MAFLSVPSAPIRKISQRFTGKNAELDAFLSSDVDAELEMSFASNMSLNSPPKQHLEPSVDYSRDEVPMDISPAPVKLASAPKGRPRAHTSAGTTRLFGRDVSNESLDAPLKSTNASKNLKRPGLPMMWMQETSDISTATQSIEMPSSDAMDVDTSFLCNSAPPSPPPVSAAPTITQFTINVNPPSAGPTVTSFNKLFFDNASPQRDPRGRSSADSSRDGQPCHKKRRSLSPHDELFSSPAAPSPSVLKLERMAGQQAARKQSQLGATLGVNEHNKRPRRPALSAVVPPADSFDGPFSAFPAYENKENASAVPGGADRNATKEKDREIVGQRHHVLPPVRRAFSAMLPPGMLDASMTSEGDSWLDGADPSSPAVQYARRQQVKTIRRCDGTEDFRSQTDLLRKDGEVIRTLRRSEERGDRSGEKSIGAARAQQPSQHPAVPMERDTPRSKYLSAGGASAPGLGGFGDNEAMGKILPCHRVREDGLMRIKSKTLDDLLDGKYNSQIVSYYIIDCRFDYEYNGGHIPGAININTTAGVEDFFLGPAATKPRPSTSGDAHKKTIIVFHCEFSCKRAPTFAKHLRAKDRAMNNHVYPKIHYPEVYVLEGGYCQYFKDSADRCQPRAYVRMDDPHYAASRREDLDQFRKAKFGRTKSYAYGDSKGGLTAQLAAQPKRSSASTGAGGAAGATTLFPAANIARTRRTGGMLQTLEEDPSLDHQSDDDTDIGDSPCPPPNKGVQFKGKKIGRAPLARAETYGPSRATLGH